MAVTLHTSSGDLKFEILCDTAPRTSFNFLALAASGYYNGTTFHRNIRGFMIQGGDPTGMVVCVGMFLCDMSWI
jgi:peptidyl-prolyl cis-trans isomerase-like 3